jgi:hypothetical protein
LAVDTNSLFVDSTTNRVGLGTVTPTTTLDVVGSSNISGNATIGGNLIVDTNALFVHAANSRVGLGTVSPATTLDVVGNVGISDISLVSQAPDFVLVTNNNGLVQKQNIDNLNNNITNYFSVCFNTITNIVDLPIATVATNYYFPFPSSGSGLNIPLSSLSAMTYAKYAYSPFQYSVIIPTKCRFRKGTIYVQFSGSNNSTSQNVTSSFQLMRYPRNNNSSFSFDSLTIQALTSTNTGNVTISGQTNSQASTSVYAKFGENDNTILEEGDLVFLRGSFSTSISNYTINNPTISGTLMFLPLQ